MLRFSIPCVLSLLVSSLYNIVDQIFIGNSKMSALGNAAVGVVFPVFIISQAFAWCFGDGCAAFLSICQGKNDMKNAHKFIGTGITLTFLSALLLMAFFYPIKVPMLTLFGASENSLGYAIEYFDIIVAFFPFYMLSNMMNGIIRADGSPSLAMAAILVGAIVNIALDPVFIYALDMGMSGAAWATVIGQAASFTVSAVAMSRTKSFKLTLKSFLPDFKVFWGALSLGISTFITQITILVISVSCNIMLAKYGMASSYGVDIPIAIIGIQSKVFTVVINLVVGIVLGCQPIISYNMGAMKYGRVKKLYKNMTLCTLVIGLASTVLFVFFPRAIVGLFGQPTNIPNPDAYWEFGEKTFRIFLSCVTFTCFVKVSSIFFQSAGKPIYAVISSTVRDIVCFLPLIILLPMSMGIDGILFAAPIADVISMAIAVIITVAFWRTLGRAEREK